MAPLRCAGPWTNAFCVIRRLRQRLNRGDTVKTLAYATATLAMLASGGAALADDGPYKGRMSTVGAKCQNNTYFDIEATIVGNKVEGTLLGSAFRGPRQFSGDATDAGFTAVLVFAALGNLRVDIAGTRSAPDTFTVTTKWNGGGANNCETSGTAKKA